MPTLYRLLYRSHCAIDGAPADVAAKVVALVDAARAENERHGVTGALLFSSGLFVQALEGPLDAVEETFERICADMRHRDVQLIEFTAAETRAFAEWSMAAICPKGALVSLCATVDAIERTRIDPETAGAVIKLMRSMIVADLSRPRMLEKADAMSPRSA